MNAGVWDAVAGGIRAAWDAVAGFVATPAGVVLGVAVVTALGVAAIRRRYRDGRR